MAELQGKKALVTGGSRGIGAAIALALAEKGADVAITYQQSGDQAAAVVRQIEQLGGRGFAIKADSGSAEGAEHSVTEAVRVLGGLDILVNNAGIARAGMLVDMPLTDIEDILNVNVKGVILTSKAAIPHLKQGGRIISIGSGLAHRVPWPGMSVYSMSKSALMAFNQGLARELGPSGITVNIVHPGSTDTDMNPADGAHSEGQRTFTALGHYGKPQDVAAAVAFLASPAARQITGTSLTVDGGANA